MKTIWKFYVRLGEPVPLPEGAKILSAGAQGQDTVIWALVDPTARKLERKIVDYITGDPMPDDPGTFIGTVFHDNGDYVLHVFDAGPA